MTKKYSFSILEVILEEGSEMEVRFKDFHNLNDNQ